MYISILGRQPSLGAAELETIYGGSNVHWFSDQTIVVTADHFDFEQLGGSQKAGRIVAELSTSDWRTVSQHIISTYLREWSMRTGKVNLGISTYGFSKLTVRDVQKTGIVLKQKLRQQGISLRLIPNSETTLNTATSHHNKLGLSPNKVELLVVRGNNGKTIIAESVGAQNITALAARDQARPHTDAFVGMLPPKLARMMVNLAVASPSSNHTLNADTVVLDPFCGTGVVLQEALLLGYTVYGTDLSEKMIDYSTKNLQWLNTKFRFQDTMFTVEQGDAMTHRWRSPITAIVCESYLGQPFSAPPSPAKLTEVRGNCNHIISTFLRNISSQVPAGTPLCIAIPAWRDANGRFTHLPFIKDLEKLGYIRRHFSCVADHDLLYYRETQVVARELLVLAKR